MSARVGKFSFVLGVGLLAAGIATAQQTSSTTSTQMGKAETTATTRTINATVVSVNGNKVVGKDASGKATEYTIPDGFKFQFEGKDIGVGDLKPGMKVSATVTTTTTTTPVTVTTINKGKVRAVSGTNIIVEGPNGIRRFSNADAEKRGAKIERNGQQISLSELRPGDVFTAVFVTDAPPKVVSEREAKAMASAAPKPTAAPALAVAAAPAPAPAAVPAPAPAPAKKLPKTASQVPLVGLMGALSIAAGLGLSLLRRSRTR
jgi:LPXTG-motif cell wall-anchored protein